MEIRCQIREVLAIDSEEALGSIGCIQPAQGYVQIGDSEVLVCREHMRRAIQLGLLVHHGGANAQAARHSGVDRSDPADARSNDSPGKKHDAGNQAGGSEGPGRPHQMASGGATEASEVAS